LSWWFYWASGLPVERGTPMVASTFLPVEGKGLREPRDSRKTPSMSAALVASLSFDRAPRKMRVCARIRTGFSGRTGTLSMPLNLSRRVSLTHLDRLEAESIHIFREVAANFSRPVMLYSIGKDSSVLLHLAMKSFYPAKPPFPLLHVDTTWKFREMIAFRDRMARELGFDLIVHINEEGVRDGVNPFDHGSNFHTHVMKTVALRQALDKYRFDAAFGGARRDEEKSRAKERIFSFRNLAHAWDPKNQRPEMWRIYNTRISAGESIRVFPLSNWTELDIWQYILREGIPIVPLYFAKKRPVVERDGMLIMVDDERMKLRDGEKIEERMVRFRTLGCYPLTGAIESEADSLEAIVGEMLTARTSERQGRLIDKDEAGSMEKKKREGYF
jgi:sulfate adenylyltransferase subunit 2